MGSIAVPFSTRYGKGETIYIQFQSIYVPSAACLTAWR
jgi:hypothetical protein